jgi:hypothetical protein
MGLPDTTELAAAILKSHGDTGRFFSEMVVAATPEKSAAVLEATAPPTSNDLLALLEAMGFLATDLDAAEQRWLAWLLLIPLLRSEDPRWSRLGAEVSEPFLEREFRISEQIWLAQLVAPVKFALSEQGRAEQAMSALQILRKATLSLDLMPEASREDVRWSVATLRGLLALRAGDLAECMRASELYDEAVEVLAEVAEHQPTLDVHVNLGKAFEARRGPGDQASAIASYRTGLALRSRPREPERVAAAWFGIGRCLPAEDTAARRTAYRQAWKRATALDARARLSLGTRYAFAIAEQAKDKSRRLREAIAVLREAIAQAEAGDLASNGATTLQWGLLASWLDRSGQTEAADRAMHASIKRLQGMKEAFYGEPDDGEEMLSETYAGFYPRVIDHLIDKRALEDAYDVTAALQAHLLTDMLSVNWRSPGGTIDDALWAEGVGARERALAAKGTPDAGRLDAAFQGLVAEIRVRDAGVPTLLAQDRPEWRLLAGRLAADQALVVLAPTYRRLAVFVIRRIEGAPTLDCVIVGSSEIAEMTELVLGWVIAYETFRFGGPPTPERMREVQNSLGRTYAHIGARLKFGRLFSRLKAIRRLVLVPYWPLTLLPVHMIPDRQGRSLATRFDITVLPNPVWAIVDRRASIGTNATATAVIDSHPVDAPLPFAHLEATALSLAFAERRVLSGRAASRDALIEALENSEIVHVACHAEHNFKGYGKLLLAGGETLAYADVCRLAVRAKLVVLSSCESGLSSVMSMRHEVFSLPTALIAAGACTVVGTLWQVEERAAALLMGDFFRRLAHRRHVPDALIQAQHWLAGATSPELADAAERLAEADPAAEGGVLIRRWAQRLRAPERASARPYADAFYWQSFYALGA